MAPAGSIAGRSGDRTAGIRPGLVVRNHEPWIAGVFDHAVDRVRASWGTWQGRGGRAQILGGAVALHRR